MGEVTSSPMGKTYLSTAVTEDGKPKQLVSNTRTRLEFAEVPNRNDEGPRVYDVLRAYAGCNELSGTVDRTRTELTFTGVVTTTDHACTGGTAEVETAILTTLRARVTYTIDYNRLTLLTPTGTGLDLTAVR